jgi:hypothetical protein
MKELMAKKHEWRFQCHERIQLAPAASEKERAPRHKELNDLIRSTLVSDFEVLPCHTAARKEAHGYSVCVCINKSTIIY